LLLVVVAAARHHQGSGDGGALLYAGLVSRVADELDLYEALPKLVSQQQQQEASAGSAAWMQLVQGWQAPCGSLVGSSSGAVQQPGAVGIRLVCRDGLLPQQLLQEVDKSMHKTAARLVAAARAAA
jgi:hypothetical protein